MQIKKPASAKIAKLKCRLKKTIVVIGILEIVLWQCPIITHHVVATSPDGKLTVRVNAATLLGGLTLPFETTDDDKRLGRMEPLIIVELIDNATGKRRRVDETEQGGLIGDYWNDPLSVDWSADSKEFSVIIDHDDIEGHGEMSGQYTVVYEVPHGFSSAKRASP